MVLAMAASLGRPARRAQGLVDLELIQRQALEVGQRGVAGAEIVEREATPCACSARILAMTSSTLHQQAFGQLELEPARVGAAGLQHLEHRLTKSGARNCALTLTDRLSRPSEAGHPSVPAAAGAFQHPAPQGQDQAGFLGQGMNSPGATRPRRGAASAAAPRRLQSPLAVHLRLGQHELLLLHRLAQGLFELGALLDHRLHGGIEEAQHCARILGPVHGQVGLFQQFVHRRGAAWNSVAPMLALLWCGVPRKV
jgi:hypothetical protein